MKVFAYNKKEYLIDHQGFLTDFTNWDKDFAIGVAFELGIKDGLKEKHWEIINFIRDSFKKTGLCPLVYDTCKSNGISLKELKELFSTGYLRGACKLAGITYKEGYIKQFREKMTSHKAEQVVEQKVYRINVQGFLIDPSEWDPKYAIFRAQDMKIKGGLTDKHWEIIDFIRSRYEKTGVVPHVYETCEANKIDLEDLEDLFPDGYHRGAVKIAGLSVR